jgi:hypothetical protein
MCMSLTWQASSQQASETAAGGAREWGEDACEAKGHVHEQVHWQCKEANVPVGTWQASPQQAEYDSGVGWGGVGGGVLIKRGKCTSSVRRPMCLSFMW